MSPSGPRDSAGLSSGCGVACTTDKDGATQNHSALLPLWRPNLKRPCAIDDGGQGLSSSVPFGPSLVRLTASVHEEDVGKKSEVVAIIAARVVSSASGLRHQAL